MKLLYLYTLLLLSSCSCHSSTTSSNIITDTIQIDKGYIADKINCTDFTGLYYNRFGIAISKYYVVKDSLSLDINKDGLIDNLIILSPTLLENSNISCGDFSPTRILVEVLNFNDGARVRNIYSNLISDIGGVLSKYNGIKKTKRGFEISHYSGSKYSWSYSMEFSTELADSISLIKIKKTCSVNSNDIDVEYLTGLQLVKSFDIMDTINNNCGCDVQWMELEKTETLE